jgi:hypothetical protein
VQRNVKHEHAIGKRAVDYICVEVRTNSMALARLGSEMRRLRAACFGRSLTRFGIVSPPHHQTVQACLDMVA